MNKKYVYPTIESTEYAVEEGWNQTKAKLGFGIFEYDNTGLLEIEVINDAYFFNNETPNDEEAAREAERIGYCKIIPVNELPSNFFIGHDDCRYFGWIDTEENRRNIINFCKNN